jgi:hypothetical protein
MWGTKNLIIIIRVRSSLPEREQHTGHVEECPCTCSSYTYKTRDDGLTLCTSTNTYKMPDGVNSFGIHDWSLSKYMTEGKKTLYKEIIITGYSSFIHNKWIHAFSNRTQWNWNLLEKDRPDLFNRDSWHESILINSVSQEKNDRLLT